MMSSEVTDKSNVIIIIPSYNEGDRVVQVVNEVKSQGFERIVVVDDHSNDDSMANLQQANITILHHPLNRGAGAATETGLEYCRTHLQFDTVITIDADTQHNPGDIIHLLEAHRLQLADITIGNRFLNESNRIPSINRFFNFIANITTSVLSGSRVTDSQSGFKAFSKNALDKIRLEQDHYEYCSEIFIKARQHNLKVIDVPVRTYYPEEIKGKGQNLIYGVRTFFNLIYSSLFKN